MNYFRSFFLAGSCLMAVTSCSLTTCPLKQIAQKFDTFNFGQPKEHRSVVSSSETFQPELIGGYFSMRQSVRPTYPTAPSKATLVSIPPLLRDPDSLRSVRTTAYTHNESDHLVYGNLSAIGKPLKFGNIRSAAADWSRYPQGTLFRIADQPGILYQVDDYGSALVGTDTIDLYKPSRSAMNDWGVRHVNIEVVKWGCYHTSMNIMKDRTRYPHVRRMFDSIQSRLYHTSVPAVKKTGDKAITAML
jgi:3D (Asp-Asp-Asp) domain-containing protein